MTSSPERAADAKASGQAYLLLAFTALCWAGNSVLGRLAVGEVSPMALVTLRWLGVVVLLVVARNHLKRDWPVLRGRLWFVLIMGILGFSVFNAFFYVAAHSTGAINIGILQGSIPVFVLFGGAVLFRTQFTALQVVGIVVTLVGVILVAVGGDLARLAALAFNYGDILMLCGCLIYAAYTLGLRKRPAVSSLGLFTAFAIAALVTSLPLIAAEAAMGRLQWPTPTGWAIVAVVTVFPSLLAQLSFMHGVQLIGPNRAGIFVNLVPVFAAILAVVFLGEPFEFYHGLALVFVLGGIWIAERGKAA